MKIANSSISMDSSHQSLSTQFSSLRLGVRMKKSDWEASQSLTSDEPEGITGDSQEKENKSADKPAAVIRQRECQSMRIRMRITRFRARLCPHFEPYCII